MNIPLKNLNEIAPNLFEIDKSFRADMRVPARVYASQKMLADISTDRSLWQLVNTATLPGILKYALAMPDIHEGYGFPIGGVIATGWDDGVVSPGGVGYDINCGVRLLRCNCLADDITDKLSSLADQLMRDTPSGLGRGGKLDLSVKDLDLVLERGVDQMIEWGYGDLEDLANIESGGSLAEADPSTVSERAKSRGRDQVGTLGSGNHFLEVQKVTEIYDDEIAKAWGLQNNSVTVMIHTGSRGFGHQVCTDSIRTMMPKLSQWNISLPDKELVCAPLDSPEGQKYLAAMSAASNFAWCNRQMLCHLTRESFIQVFDQDFKLNVLYDVAHNIAKIENHNIDGKKTKVCVHRKGAIRAFGPGHPDLSTQFQTTGQPVLIPGTMGTSSYILAGTESAMEKTFGTVCHGAGRRMSRKGAKKMVSGNELRKQLENKGIEVRCSSNTGLAEEAPLAYKDIEDVIEVVVDSGLAKKVAKVEPLAVIKGG